MGLGKNFFMVKVVKFCKGLLGELVGSQSLQGFKTLAEPSWGREEVWQCCVVLRCAVTGPPQGSPT